MRSGRVVESTGTSSTLLLLDVLCSEESLITIEQNGNVFQSKTFGLDDDEISDNHLDDVGDNEDNIVFPGNGREGDSID